MSDKIKVGLALGGLFAAGALALTALNHAENPDACRVDGDGGIYLIKDGKESRAGSAVILTDDGKSCVNDNGSTPPDWNVPVVPGPAFNF